MSQILNLEPCGCGRPGRYMTPSGFACNKYFRCAGVPPPVLGDIYPEWTDDQKAELRAALDRVFGKPSGTIR